MHWNYNVSTDISYALKRRIFTWPFTNVWHEAWSVTPKNMKHRRLHLCNYCSCSCCLQLCLCLFWESIGHRARSLFYARYGHKRLHHSNRWKPASDKTNAIKFSVFSPVRLRFDQMLFDAHSWHKWKQSVLIFTWKHSNRLYVVCHMWEENLVFVEELSV